MRRVAWDHLTEYLRLIESELRSEVQIIVIGGSAVTLGYVSVHATTDLDLWPIHDPAFWGAVDRCRGRIGALPTVPVSIASAPLNFEDRLRRLEIAGLARLVVLIPEAHDLAIMKIVRGEAHDYQAVEDIHEQEPLSIEILVERYQETLTQLIGPERRFRLNLLSLVSRLFGEDSANELEASLPTSSSGDPPGGQGSGSWRDPFRRAAGSDGSKEYDGT